MILVLNLRQLLNGNKLNIRFLCYVILIFNLNNYYSQYAEVLKNEKGIFYIHTLEEGNTLYGIQQWYGCDVDELLLANPGIERGLVNGTVVYVPVKRKTIQHTVQKQETLYGLSKIYFVSVDSIIQQNPEAENGLKVDQKLTIKNAVARIAIVETTNKSPQESSNQLTNSLKISFSDSIVEHTVLSQETMYTIAKRFMIPVQSILDINGFTSTKLNVGQKIKIPIKKENLSPVPTRTPIKILETNTASYWSENLPSNPRIAILLPLNLDSLTTVPKNVSNFALDYYIGLKIALDSLEKSGYNAQIKVIDYYQKGRNMNEVIAIEKLASYDLIFAPFDKKEGEILHAWSIGKPIHIVYPTSMTPSAIKNNPLALSYSTTNEQLIVGLAKKMRSLSGRVVLIKSDKPEESWMQNLFTNTYRFESKSNDNTLIEATWKNFRQFEQIGGEMYFVYLSTDKVKVQELLKMYSDIENFTVVGLKDWTEWKEVNADIKNKYKFICVSQNQFEYDDEEIKLFHRQFRNAKQADLNKTICLGYDITKNVLEYLRTKTPQFGLISNFNPVLRNATDGYENSAGIPIFFQEFKTLNFEK